MEVVNQALNFQTRECNITGGCDVFTTKPVTSDKKLCKTLDQHLDLLIEESEAHINMTQNQSFLDGEQSLCHEIHSKSDPNSFWKQMRRMSVSKDSGGIYTNNQIKTQKLNDQNLKELVLHSDNGYLSSSSFDSHKSFNKEAHRRNSSVSNVKRSGILKKRSNSTNESGKTFKGGRTSSITKEALNIGPFGPITENASRKTFAYLVAILNASYPDHDFILLEPTDFVKSSVEVLISKFENSLIALGKQPQEWIWETINLHMDLKDCVTYEYSPARSFLDDEPGHLWSLMWFMFNKKRKRVAFFYLNTFRLKIQGSDDNSTIVDDEDETRHTITNRLRRKLTIDHESIDFEGEYDLTYSSNDENAIDDEEDPINSNV